MAASGHDKRWREDFRLVHELGLRCLRYGPPYYSTHLGPGHYDWAFAEAAFAELRRLEIVPEHKIAEFVEEAGKVVARRYPRLRAGSDYTHMISEAAWRRMQDLVEDARSKGGLVHPFNPARVDLGAAQRAFAPTLVTACMTACA